MNILKKLLFSFRGKIGRADFIYGIIYGYLLALVSLDALSQPLSNWKLIGSGLDIWFIAQYAVSVIGIILALWILLAVLIKRARTLWYTVGMSLWAFIFPPLVLFGLRSDREPFVYNGWMSVADKCFFYSVIGIFLLSIWQIYQIETSYKIWLTIIALIATICTVLFNRDRNPAQIHPKQKYSGMDSTLDLLFVVALVFFIRLFVLSPFQIIGPSMENTFHGGNVHKNANGQYGDGEFILVDKMTYRLTIPKRGDVVVFSPRIGPAKKYLIKRVIGLPGDKVKIDEGFVFIATAKNPTSFIKIDESAYLGKNFWNTCIYLNCEGDEPVIFDVPKGHYFLMGDNRPASLDSRHCFENCDEYGSDIRYIPASSISWRVGYALGHFDMFERILPTPILGTMKQVIPWRGRNILNMHTYPELDS